MTQAVVDLTAAVSKETDTVNNATAGIAEAIKELANSEDPAVAAAAAQIETLVGQINTANTNLATATAGLPAPPAAAAPPAATEPPATA